MQRGKVLILVAGIPGAGKTRFANYLSEKLQIALICKDKLKEIIWDQVQYDTTERENTLVYGRLAYDLSFHFCETLMKASQPIVFESNFTKPADDILQPMVQKYDYKVINVLFSGDYEMIYRRFAEREKTSERHPGLVASTGYVDDFQSFKNATQNCKNFRYGDIVIDVDATDFSKLSYDDLTEEILAYMRIRIG